MRPHAAWSVLVPAALLALSARAEKPRAMIAPAAKRPPIARLVAKRPPIARDVKELKRRIGEITTIQSAAADLTFSDETGATPRAALTRGLRGQQQALLAGLVDQRLKSPALARLLGRLQGQKLTPPLQAAVRDYSRVVEDARLVPTKLVQEQASLANKTYQVYEAAKKKADYKAYAPSLEKTIALSERTASLIKGNVGKRLGKEPTTYEVLLTEHMGAPHTEAELDKLFGDLRQPLVKLVRQIQQAKQRDTRSFAFLDRKVDAAGVETFTSSVLRDMGFSFERGKVSHSVHPFTTGISAPYDVRITVDRPTGKQISIREALEIFFSGVHEGGHALYDQGGTALLGRLGMTGGPMELHESQSRLWENNVARSRPFWQHYFPLLQKRFPAAFKNVSVDDFYRAVNHVEVSPIRVQADEVTYNLHVLLRYQLEKKIFATGGSERKALLGKLPAEWNRMMKEYVGCAPKNDREGVLQDVHWTDGSFGYFPSYTLGNLAAAQIYDRARQAIPDLEGQIARGNLKPLQQWLRKNIHSVGQTETPDQLLRRVTGEPLSAKHFVDYLSKKYDGIYGISR
jgi:carboxypeptidase Taq